MNKYAAAPAALALVALAGCHKTQTQQTYEAVPVERRNIVVSASASGAIEPVLTVDVKSKASGEIITMNVQTGDDVKEDQLLATIDPRIPRNNLAQAEANLQVAQAQLSNANAQLARSDTLFKAQAITQTEYDQARLDQANANAAVIRARSDLENARDRMTDTRLRAPLAGTIIAKNVELGTVISSPTTDVGGGTVLFRMANLDTVQIRSLVDETDIAKVQPGLRTTITVDAYPNRPFEGSVLKVEPQATVQQNVTMFNVLIRIPNPNHLLKPGMNTEVEIHVGQANSVLAIPNAALRTQRDVASAAQVLGLDPNDVQNQLAAARQQQTPSNRDSASMGGGVASDGPRRDSSAAQKGGAPQVMMTLPSGQTVPAPPGITAQQVRLAQSAMQKRMSGGTPSDEEQTAMRVVFQAMRASGQFSGGGGQGFRRNAGDPSSYIVFTLKQGKPAPVQIRTGLTDLDYVEVVSGLTEQDTVLVLPSASLVNAQRDMQQRMRQFTGGGLPGVQQQQPAQTRPAAPPAAPTRP